MFTLFGTVLGISALNVDGAANGPTCAVLNAQIMLLLVVDLIIQHTVPSLMQWSGLILGVLGTLILSIPDQMLECWYCIICRRPKKLTDDSL